MPAPPAGRRPARPAHRAVLVLAVLAAAVALLVPVTGARAAPHPGTEWVRMAVPADVGPWSQLFGVSAPDRSAAWAVGVERIGADLSGDPLVLRLRHGRWSKVPLGVTWRGELRRVSAVGRDEVYVAGTDAARNPRVLRWDGRSWHEEVLPREAGETLVVYTMAAAPGHRPWMLVNDGGRLSLLHRTATGWERVAVPPPPFTTRTITVDGHGGLWVAGYEPVAEAPAVRLFRYVDGVARAVPTADPAPAVFPNDVVAGPAGVWVGGSSPTGASAIVGWDGRRWIEGRFDRPAFGAASVTADGWGRPAWALHTFAVDGSGVPEPGYLKLTAGTWVRRPSAPNAGTETGTPEIRGFTAVPGTWSSIAVGWVSTTDRGVVPRIERESSRR